MLSICFDQLIFHFVFFFLFSLSLFWYVWIYFRLEADKRLMAILFSLPLNRLYLSNTKYHSCSAVPFLLDCRATHLLEVSNDGEGTNTSSCINLLVFRINLLTSLKTMIKLFLTVYTNVLDWFTGYKLVCCFVFIIH